MIGMFDSGLGGLTALRRLRVIAPHTSYVYFGDTGRLPYGTRSQETILRYALSDLQFLSAFSPDAVLVACGTVSANALRVLEAVAPFPVYGVIEPAAEKAVQVTQNGRVGVLGTNATIRTHAYRRALHALAPTLAVEEVACPLFVPMVENGLTDAKDPVVLELCKRAVTTLLSRDIDTLILGCTHYPLLADAIQTVLPHVTMIDPGAVAVEALVPYLGEEQAPAQQYFVSDDAAHFAMSAARFLGEMLTGQVQQISLPD